MRQGQNKNIENDPMQRKNRPPAGGAPGDETHGGSYALSA
jgi:hypothetical protein